MSFDFHVDFDLGTMSLYHARESDIKNMQWPTDMRELKIIGEYLDHIDIPDGVEIFTGGHLGLKSVCIPDSMRTIYLHDNFLHELELPRGIEYVTAYENYITLVSFRGGDPTSLIELDLHANRLLELDFKPPESLEILDLRINNYLDYNRVPPSLMRVAEVTPRG